MLSTLQLYLEVTTAVLLVAVLGIIALFIAAAITGDRTIIVGASCAIMVLTAAILAARLWRLTRPRLVLEDDIGSE
jgi:MFS superfamily sulfate permease-like transporter